MPALLSPRDRALLGGGAKASAYAPYPAPGGFHWEFVTFNGASVTAATLNNTAEPVVALVGN